MKPVVQVTSKAFKSVLQLLRATRIDRALTPLTRGRGVIFMLHHVLPDAPAPFSPNAILQVTPSFLDQVIAHVINEGYDVISLDDAVARMSVPNADHTPFACFTFDDGYLDNAVHAYPLFKKHNVPFAIYVAPNMIDGTTSAWWRTFESVIGRSDVFEGQIGDGQVTMACRTPAEKYAAFNSIYWWLRSLPDAQRHRIVNAWARERGIDPLESTRGMMMTWDQIRALADDDLVTFGAHTMSHVALAKVSASEACTEMAQSIARLEAELARPCRHFAYPYGDAGSAGAREFAIAEDLGLASAVTTRKGLISADAGKSMTSLPRLSLMVTTRMFA